MRGYWITSARGAIRGEIIAVRAQEYNSNRVKLDTQESDFLK